ncbi:MAG: hypothetical protein C4519_05005 [Desulfobacteraceae bacterium]|nr:MAG: hypothetical protein C4519_05005 [Desulfobacteraceae bacterium]
MAEQPKKPKEWTAIKVAVWYALWGGLWIVFSDRLLLMLFGDIGHLAQFQTYKGWLYVLVTALLLFWLVAKMSAGQQQLNEELHKLNAELDQRVAARTAELEEARKNLVCSLADKEQARIALENANARLKELDRLKSMFIASMSHELRTPLNSIIGFSSILLAEWLGPLNAEQKENQAAILESGRHLLALINDVIDISKIEAGMLEPNYEAFDLDALLEEAVKAARKEATGKGVELVMAAEAVRMHTDRRRLLQCLLNLLGNAVKFTPAGAITVTARQGGGGEGGARVEISVADTGIGIRKEDMGKLFAPFVRLHAPGDANYPGTGLGLYLTAKLAREVLQGEIAVTSVFGAGSTFTLRLPVTIGQET